MNIFKDIVDKNGEQKQMMVAVEELAELQQAISKVYRYGFEDKTIGNLYEEIADVKIVIMELCEIIKNHRNEDVNNEIYSIAKQKLERTMNEIGL